MSLAKRFRRASTLVFLLGAPFTSSCGGETTNSQDSASVRRSPDAGLGAGTVTPGNGTTTGSLDLSIDVAGKPTTAFHLACGACVDMIARVSGGNPPYDYTWSDPALHGPGPFHVCPTQSTKYGVTLTDTATSGEFGHASAQATASVALVVGACPVGFTDAQAPHDAGRPIIDARPPPPPPPQEDASGRGCPCSNAATWPDEQYVANPSFEGTPVNGLPSGWTACLGHPDLQPAAGAPLAGGRPPAPAEGSAYVGLAYSVNIGEALKQPLVAGQHYWMSWDGAYTASVVAITGIPFGEFDVWIGNTPCATDQLVSSSTIAVNQTAAGWSHTCTAFVPEHAASYVTIGARVANGFGNGYVSLDGLRMAPYEVQPSYYTWNDCGTMPLGTPFP